MSAARRLKSKPGRLKRAARQTIWDSLKGERVVWNLAYRGNERHKTNLQYSLAHRKNLPKRKLARFVEASARQLAWKSLPVEHRLLLLNRRPG